LIIPTALPLAQTLASELSAFRLRPKPKPSEGDPWREMPNDDLVFAVGIVLWAGERVLAYEKDQFLGKINQAQREKQEQIQRFHRMWARGY
jgi:hypothetical protein